MTDRIAKVIEELSAAANLLVEAEVRRTWAAKRKQATLEQGYGDGTQEEKMARARACNVIVGECMGVDEKFLADFNPANCGHLAELIRELREAYREACP